MKPHHWVCSTVLLARSFQILWSQKASFSSRGHCSQPRFWFYQLFLIPAAQCSTRGSDLSAMARQPPPSFAYNLRTLKRLGSEKHTMDVIVAGQQPDATEHVIFFGGDVQDYPENMMSHRDNGKYVQWNSLATAEKLVERYPKAMILVVKPHYMHLKTFSVYSQFVPSNDFGIPTHSPDFGAWRRLVQVYKEAVGIVLKRAQDELSTGASEASSSDGKTESEEPKEHHSEHSESIPLAQGVEHQASNEAQEMQGASLPVDKLSDLPPDELPEVPVHLIGFSRGCIVLNQLLCELETAESGEVQNFISHIRTMTWLDGGHSGGSNTWITDPAILKRLAALDVEIHVHVTPYQVKDEMRRWIGKEKRKFVELLQKNGAKVTDTLHFENEPKSIDNHFRVLEVF